MLFTMLSRQQPGKGHLQVAVRNGRVDLLRRSDARIQREILPRQTPSAQTGPGKSGKIIDLKADVAFYHERHRDDESARRHGNRAIAFELRAVQTDQQVRCRKGNSKTTGIEQQ